MEVNVALLIGYCLRGLAVGALAVAKGRRFGIWFMWGFCAPFALLHVLFAHPGPRLSVRTTTRFETGATDRAGEQATADSTPSDQESEPAGGDQEAEGHGQSGREHTDDRRGADTHEYGDEGFDPRTATEAQKAAYYGRVLGLEGRVTRNDIKHKYRELIVQYHPDKVSQLGPKLRMLAEEESKRINEAYRFFQDTYKL